MSIFLGLKTVELAQRPDRRGRGNTKPQAPQKPKQKVAAPARTRPQKPKTVAVSVKRKQTRINRLAQTGPQLPKAGSTKSAQFKTTAKDGKKVHANLKKKSPWYTSISDPLHGAGCKIPDGVGEETGTLQLLQRGTISVPAAANGTCGVRTCCLHPTSAGIPPNEDYGFVQTLDTSTTGAVVWEPDAIEWDTTDALQAYAQGVRVVSAALYVQPESSLSTCSGEICLFVKPGLKSGLTTYNDFANNYGSVLLPLNSNQASMIRWFPMSQGEKTYDAFYNPNAISTDSLDFPPFWELGFLTSGVPGETTFRYSIVVNYEFLPKENSINILSASPSPQDAEEVDLVENWISNEPAAHPVSNKVVASPPSPVSPTHEDNTSGFGMFYNVLEELVPIVLDGAMMLL